MGYEIDFLPVGDGERCGDAIALRFGNLRTDPIKQTVVVVDGGFKESGEKLVDHIRRYYGTDHVDLVVSTHPDSDHANGLAVVLEELSVGCLWMHQPWYHTKGIADLFHDGRVTDNSVRESLRKSLDTARDLERLATKKNIPIIEPFAGVCDQTQQVVVLGPTQEFYKSLLPAFAGTPEPLAPDSLVRTLLARTKDFAHRIAERWDYETLNDDGETTAENNSSVVLLVYEDNQRVLLTGDAGIPALTDVADLLEYNRFDFDAVKLIQVPHHGSHRNVGPSILNRIVGPKRPSDEKIKHSYLSVTKDSAPKHPSKKVTNAFRRRGAPVYPTLGRTIWYYYNAPLRKEFSAIEPLPFYEEVEE